MTNPETWCCWLDDAHSPALNMALDEALLNCAAASGRCIIRFYAWDRPSVSIGYLQDCAAGELEGFEFIRRPTGGGVVFHDHDLTYTVAVPAGHWIADIDRESSYGHINRAVTHGLNRCNLAADLTDDAIPHTVERRTMVCFKNPTRYDIVLDGQKVAGSAQRRLRQGILHQGSIHFGGPLPIERQKLVEEIIQGFKKELGIEVEEFQPSPEMLSAAQTIAAQKYLTDAWNRKR